MPQPQRRTQLLTGHSLLWPLSSLATSKMRVEKFFQVQKNVYILFLANLGLLNYGSKSDYDFFCSIVPSQFQLGLHLCLLIYLLIPFMEKAMAPHSSTLTWKIPWTEEPGGLQSMGSLRVGHD